MGKISKAHVTIRFFGDDLEPEELTRLLGSQPSRARRKGEQRTLSSGELRVERYGSWSINDSEESVAVEIDEQVNALLDKLTDDIGVRRDLSSRYDADVYCGVMMDTWNEGFALEAATLKRLADRSLLIGFDIYAPVDTWYDEQDDGAESG